MRVWVNMGSDEGRGWSVGIRRILSNCLFDLASLILLIGQGKQGKATMSKREISKERGEAAFNVYEPSFPVCLFISIIAYCGCCIGALRVD